MRKRYEEPVSAEPVAVVGADFTLLWAGAGPIAPLVQRHGLKVGSQLYAAPVATQPDLTQQTLDDVKAGIPARDAEIEALRKEIETLQDADKVDAWQCTTTLTESDDLIWLYCQDTNTIGGPVASSPEFIDSWTHWAWVEHPSTASISAARKEQE